MRVGISLTKDISQVVGSARVIEDMGADALWMGETRSDPCPSLTLAAEHTRRLRLGTGVLIAFARSPMVTAYSARELAKISGGRFTLGLGSQVQAHITRRFGMPWSHPVARMEEYVAALRAIWSTWKTGTPLAASGRFFDLTLMTPFFTPDAEGWDPPPVVLAGVGPAMTELAGAVADGYIVHPFTTGSYLEHVTIPALARGLEKAGRSSGGFDVAATLFVVPVADEDALRAAREQGRKQVAFYASTPAYRAVLDHHGWGAAHPELNRLSKEGRWDDMAAAVDDAMLDEFVLIDEPARLAERACRRFGRFVDSITIGSVAPVPGPELLAATVDALHARSTVRAW